MAGRFIKVRTHRDGSVDYYSDTERKWIERVKRIPQKELDKMTLEERYYILGYLDRHNGMS